MYPRPQMLVFQGRSLVNIVSRQVDTPSPAKGQGVIDPQLSQSHLAHQQASPLFDLNDDTGAGHRFHVPRMGGWQNAGPPTHEGAAQTNVAASNIQQPTFASGNDAFDEDDYFETYTHLRSPTQPEYPDPAEFGGLPVAFSPFEQDQPKPTVELLHEPSTGTESIGQIQSPVLKGVRYEGMNIFDSASPEARRRRNQKKDGSRIEQMQRDSEAVEQLERIYFSDGTLKKERLITGSVESSPPRELTPPLVPKKRQRTKASKAVLRDLSTNGLKVAKKPRQRKTATPHLQQLSEEALVTLNKHNTLCPRSTLIDFDPTDEEKLERRLTFGTTENVRRQDFQIFRDDIAPREELHHQSRSRFTDTPFTQTAESHGSLHTHGSGSTRRRVPLATCQPSSRRQYPAKPVRPAGKSLPQTFAEIAASREEDRENRQPDWCRDRKVDGSAEPVPELRITQRYFSVTGNQAPQYFSSLPPQMDFGGLSEPKYYGSTLNPLNTQLHSQEFSPYTAQRSFH